MSAYLYGFNPPFYGGPNSILSRQEDEQIIKNDILQLLLTVPGERVYRPTFGTLLRTSIFEPLDTGTLSSLRANVMSAMKNHEPRVRVSTLSLSQVGDTNQLNIILVATLVDKPETTISIDRVISG